MINRGYFQFQLVTEHKAMIFRNRKHSTVDNRFKNIFIWPNITRSVYLWSPAKSHLQGSCFKKKIEIWKIFIKLNQIKIKYEVYIPARAWGRLKIWLTVYFVGPSSAWTPKTPNIRCYNIQIKRIIWFKLTWFILKWTVFILKAVFCHVYIQYGIYENHFFIHYEVHVGIRIFKIQYLI